MDKKKFTKTRLYIKAKILRLIHGESLQTKRVRAWTNDNGEELRQQYALDENSIVFDIGGYEGQWASDIFSRYCSTLYIFEPVKTFASNIQERFKHNTKMKVFPFGLSNKNINTQIFIDDNSSSTIKHSGEKEEIKLIRVSEFLNDYSISTIDLVKINIEGEEYNLLEDLIANGLIERIKNIQVQFHDFVPDTEARMKHIQEHLQKSHHLTYCYPFVWENWERNLP